MPREREDYEDDDEDDRPRRRRRRDEDDDEDDDDRPRRASGRAAALSNGRKPALVPTAGGFWILSAVVLAGVLLWHVYMVVRSAGAKAGDYLPSTLPTTVVSAGLTLLLVVLSAAAAITTLMGKVRSVVPFAVGSLAGAFVLVIANAVSAMIIGTEAEVDNPVLRGTAARMMAVSVLRSVGTVLPLAVAGVLALAGSGGYRRWYDARRPKSRD